MAEKKEMTPFQRALVDGVLKQYADIPQVEHEFSPEFQAWAKEMIRKEQQTRRRTKTVWKAAVIAAIIAVFLATAAMAIPAVREAIIDFFLQEREDSIGITFDPEQAATAPHEIEQQYDIGYVPEEFSLAIKDVSPSRVSMHWTAANNNYIFFRQYRIPLNATSDSWHGANAAEKRTTVLMGDYLVEIIQNNENKKLVWTNNAYFFILEVPAGLPQEEIDKIFASWGPIE